jgi:hypothetical protein
MLPEDVEHRNPYLIEEIKKTVAMLWFDIRLNHWYS